MARITTGQLAKQLKTSPRRVRNILRSFKRFQDKKYTRYALLKVDIDQVRKQLAA